MNEENGYLKNLKMLKTLCNIIKYIALIVQYIFIGYFLFLSSLLHRHNTWLIIGLASLAIVAVIIFTTNVFPFHEIKAFICFGLLLLTTIGFVIFTFQCLFIDRIYNYIFWKSIYAYIVYIIFEKLSVLCNIEIDIS